MGGHKAALNFSAAALVPQSNNIIPFMNVILSGANRVACEPLCRRTLAWCHPHICASRKFSAGNSLAQRGTLRSHRGLSTRASALAQDDRSQKWRGTGALAQDDRTKNCVGTGALACAAGGIPAPEASCARPDSRGRLSPRGYRGGCPHGDIGAAVPTWVSGRLSPQRHLACLGATISAWLPLKSPLCPRNGL
jgi:hypothetical protein